MVVTLEEEMTEKADVVPISRIRSFVRRLLAVTTPRTAEGPDRALAQRLVERGIDAERRSRREEALELYQRAVRAAPDFAGAFMHLGKALQSSGKLAQAKAAYERAVEIDPDDAAAHYNLALAHLTSKHYEQAEASFRRAARNPQLAADAYMGLANSFDRLGRDEEALSALNAALAHRPECAGAMFDAATILRRMGRTTDALDHDRRGLALEPEHSRIHYRVALDCLAVGEHFEADWRLRQALALDPSFTQAELALVKVLDVQGHHAESVQRLFGIVHRESANEEAPRALLEKLGSVTMTSAGDVERAVLVRLCKDEKLSLRPLAPTILSILTNAEGFAHLQRSVDLGTDPFDVIESSARAWLNDPLFQAALPRVPLVSPAVERVVTHLRRHLLLRFDERSGWDVDALPLLPLACGISRQCYLSNYALYAADDERRIVERMYSNASQVLGGLGGERETAEGMLTTLAMYRYLREIPGVLAIVDVGEWSTPFRAVLQEQIWNRQAELDWAASIETLTSISDTTSQAVRNQYEEHPYPVWSGEQPVTADSVEALSRRLRPRGAFASRPHRILVAGCGTGEHSVQVARSYPESEVLAVDLSRSSLGYAARMSERLGLKNLTHRQADILQLGELAERFALIECCGVLHHLDDPLAGWRVLVELLDENGLMRIGLYSARARSAMGVHAAREFVRSQGFSATSDGVRNSRRAIMDLPESHPARAVLTCGDFYSLNGCRDLIMHVREHEFTPLRVAECLGEIGLRFLGMQCSRETAHRFRRMYSEPSAVLDLGAWDRFEDAFPTTFAGMYLFWCARK